MKTVIISKDKLSILENEVKKSRLKKYEKDDADFNIGFEPGGDGYAHISEDVNPDDVDLSSFEIKDRLHPKFWKDDMLDSRIRLKLLDIADDFIDTMGIDWVETDDIIMTGSLANFNWSPKFSDIDLHIVLNYKDIDENIKLVEQFLKAQTMVWNREHEDLKICGFPVEIYVQDSEDELKSGGVYSLEKNEWISKPCEDDLSDKEINKKWVQRKVAKYMDKVDSIEEKFNSGKRDEYFLEKLNMRLENIFSDIKKERADGFKHNGNEMNDRNIVFKTLRRHGYLQKIKDLEKNIYNIVNSL